MTLEWMGLHPWYLRMSLEWVVWEWVTEGHGVANSEALQEMGDWGKFGMDGPPSPKAQDDFGMDLVLPTEAEESVEIPLAAHRCGTLGQIWYREQALHHCSRMRCWMRARADLSLPTKARECIGNPSAAHIVKLGRQTPSPISSQIQEGQDGKSSEVLQVQVQHASELVLCLQALTICSNFQHQDEFNVGTWTAILHAKGSRLQQIHA
ncbi:hypothetical protein EDB86DRAFT_2835645 [Lactarius hatsudake]|nr:hypothetical protein EDB86DRAFT_2836404 [Lactarius hatsudake]KAH8979880.1 hypothetical protein EDB86DRAFT_2835645 [Lactarius hatsudake]